MGLARGAVALLLEENVRRKFSGRIATLGVQSVLASKRELDREFNRFSVRSAVTLEQKSQIDDKLLLKMLGFDQIDRFDYSNYEGANYVVDLNRDNWAEGLREKFDVVLDSGTLEHIFHVPNALNNIIRLLKIGGRAIFLSPSSNHMDHGFYMFSPTFFVDYFAANKFEVNTCYVVRYSTIPEKLWDAYEYDPRRWLRIGGLDDRPYLIFFVATRLAVSTSGVIPQQNFYSDSSELYAGKRTAHDPSVHLEGGRAGSAPLSSGPQTLQSNLRNAVRRVPFIHRLAQRTMLTIDKRRLTKKRVGRY